MKDEQNHNGVNFYRKDGNFVVEIDEKLLLLILNEDYLEVDDFATVKKGRENDCLNHIFEQFKDKELYGEERSPLMSLFEDILQDISEDYLPEFIHYNEDEE